MGQMDDAIRETVKDKKDFNKTNLKKLATRNKQVGGNHYKDCKIQPIEYIVANNLTYCEGNIVKYVTRSRRKGDGRKDIEKIIHYAEMILEMEYGE
tara:strand:+ start:1625 stop:1912 length:288 start_codon:yes stop_codon:yes gene_type:complete